MDSMTSDQTSSTIPDPPSSPRWKFDVFLSFRGEDTRRNFTDQLYLALCQKGIVTFRDNEELKKGKAISPELLNAIEKSRISVAILSTNYASSAWCLDELAKIVECVEESGSVVLPVFYGVDPSEVRYQHKGNFQKHFAKHEQRQQREKVDKWRKVLTQVANLSGWESKVGQERGVIQQIVEHIFKELNYLDFVGLDRVKKMELDLGMELDEVCVIGICGMPGLGKTHIAQVVSDRIWNKFDASSFIVNVGQTSKEKGLFHIQKQLCQDLLNSEVTMQNVNVVISRLRYKRVLIILDDVNELNQIEALAGKDGNELNDRFGRGSRIIITTRDESLLLKYGAKIHKVEELTEKEALLLFCRKAFKKDHPIYGFEEFSYGFVDYADGVPLALVVLGSFLLNMRSIEEWSSLLGRLKDSNYSGERKVSEILKVSFDGLNVAEQDIFLDIACFFKGEDASLAKRIFESCGYYPGISLNILIKKSLVSILGGKLWMHDLLQEMGKAIVRGESQKPGKRSRLWLSTDVLHVLRNNKGKEVVKGVFLSLPQQENVHLKADPFSEKYMCRLRLLKIKNVIFSGCLEFDLSNELSLLEWHGYPLKSLPSSFNPDKLVTLNMSQSRIERLWKETKKPLEKLVIMDLSDCEYLINTPDFNSVPKLERLILKGCTRLCEVHPSIEVLQSLLSLNLEGCKLLTTLPHSISLRDLKIFILSGCCKIEKLPVIGENMKQLLELHLDETAIKELPTSIKHLTALTILNLKDCKNLSSLPDVICTLLSLQILNLSGCSNLKEFPQDLGSLQSLQELDASRSGIRQAPSSILRLKNLKQLSFAGCQGGDLPAAAAAPNSSLLPSDSASSSNCIGLQLPSSFSGLSSLEILDLSDCNLGKGAFPDDIGCLSSLQNLDLSGNNFVSLPDTISRLSQLKRLRLNNCTKLQSLPNLPVSIQSVSARNCPVQLGKCSNKLTVWTSPDTGFCFINCHGSDEEEKCHSIATSGAHRLRQFHQTFYKERIPQSAFATSFLHQTKVPAWFSRQSTGSSITIPLPRDLDGNSKWMGFALCYVYVQEYDNLESTSVGRSIDELKVGFSNCFHIYTNDDPLQGPLVCKILDSNMVGSHGGWHYIPRRMFEERLNKRFIRAEIMINSPGIEVKVCGARLIFEEDVEDFVWHLTCFDAWLPELQVCQSDQIQVDQTKNSLNSFQMGKAIYESDQQDETSSLNLTKNNVAEDVCSSPTIFLIQIKPHASREYSSSPKIVGQLRRNVESLLEKLFKGHDPRCYSYGFIISLRAILPWFSHQSFGNEVGLPIPPDLYNDNKWIGFTLYVSFTLPPGDSNIACISCHLCTGASDNVVHNHVILVPRDDDSVRSYRLCVIHIPQIRFAKQVNQYCNSTLVAKIAVSSPAGAEIEMCGIRLAYKQNLEGLIQTITQCTITSPPVYYELDDESLVSDRSQRFTCITTQNSLLEAAKSSDNNTLENIIGRPSFPLQRRRALALQKQKPSRDFKSTVGQVNNFFILADIPFTDPFTKTDSVIEWKRNLDLFLQQLFMHSLSLRVTLGLRGEIINHFVQDFDPYSMYDRCFHRKDIPEGFTIRGEHSRTKRVMSSLPPNLETDDNWMGLVVCAAFSVHQHPVAGLNLGLGSSHDLTCYLISCDGSEIGVEGTCISEKKFMWSYLRGFIWLHYMPRQHFNGRLDQQSQVEASFMSDSAGLEVHNCSICLLYKQDVQQFKQTLIQHSTSLFDDVDLICQFVQDDDIHNKPPNHADETEFNGTSSALCQDEASGCTSSSSVSSSIKIVGQLGRNVESLLAELFKGGYASYYDYGFILSRTAILPWFNHQSIGNQVQLLLPQELYYDETWVGFAVYVAFTLPPGAQLNKLGSQVVCLACHLSTNTQDVEHHLLSQVNEENFVGTHQLSIFHMPRVHFPEQLRLCSLLAASFDSLTRAVEFEMCGIRLVYEQDLEGLIKTITHCAVRNPPVYFQRRLVSSSQGEHVANILSMSRSLIEEAKSINRYDPLYTLRRLSLEVMSRDPTSTTGFTEMSPINLHISAETPLQSLKEGDSLFAWKRKLENLLLCFFMQPLPVLAVITLKGESISEIQDYNPYSLHSWCFNQKQIPGWFRWESRRDKLVFSLPPNLENDNNWMGLVLCAAFSVNDDHQAANLSVDSGICDKLMCNFKFSSDQVSSGPGVGVGIGRNKFTRLYIRGLIWLLYVPCHHFKHQWNKQNQVEAFFRSDCRGLEVQKSSFRLLYKQDMEEFEQTKIQCFTSLFDNVDLIRQFVQDNAQHDKQPDHAYETNKDFDTRLIYNSCFPPNEFWEWFEYYHFGHSVTMALPPNLYNDTNWLGLALCAQFSFLEHPDANLSGLNLGIPHYLTCYLETDRGSVEPIHAYRTNNKELEWSYKLGGFIWLSYIPRGWFLDEQLNECIRLEASIGSDRGGLRVHKCGLRLVYEHDGEEFKQTIMHCMTSLFDKNEEDKQCHSCEAGSSSITGNSVEEPPSGRPTDIKGKRVALG